LIPNYL